MRRYTITVNDVTRVIDVEELTADTYRVQIEGRFVDVRLDDHRGLAHVAVGPTMEVPRAAASGRPASGRPAPEKPPVTAQRPASATPPVPPASGVAAAPAGRNDRLTAPMPGVVLEIRTSPGATVARGETLLILEAMKMKNELKAPRDGVVAEVYIGQGAQVRYGEALVRFEES